MIEFCPFCNGVFNYKYRLNNYSLYKCSKCVSGTCFPKSTSDDLKKYYDGFKFSVDDKSYNQVETSLASLLSFLEVRKRSNLSFLDVGGSGGMFAKAFERLDYGKSSYIDLDAQSCKIARNNGLNDVIHGNIEDDNSNLGEYDIVFARHVIEHLIEPCQFVDKAYSMLKKDGMAVILFPNAKSYEYLGKLRFIIIKIIKVLLGNKFNPLTAIKSITIDIMHGLDPLRHLWSISNEGISQYSKSKGYSYEVYSFRLDEKLASPFYVKANRVFFFISKLLSRINGGTHLMLVLKKSGEKN
jgi:2-polyprenyl-3-methyl-5-hydroxy-6-metoxy-1,4-benzoquinol methylase